ncbi:hypothetical protein LR090_03240, partial [Candidatus Bipolaricaulota bacterium]|nr:hypothetical protein [Candidatus Bipolaricaulota bacterium]
MSERPCLSRPRLALLAILWLRLFPLILDGFGAPSPKGADPAELEFRGLIWRTIDRCYHPGIYAEIYDPASNRRLLGKAEEVGANFLLLSVFYSCSPTGELVGNDAEAEYYLGEAIRAAHAAGFRVFLTPYVESAASGPSGDVPWP